MTEEQNHAMQIAWLAWHDGTGIDCEDMPAPNPSFTRGFMKGWLAGKEANVGELNAALALVHAQEQRINALNLENTMLKSAIEKTLSENGHLADGEVCTLIDLKRALRGDFSPWTRIDYADTSTYPEENRPCIVAWEHRPRHPERHAMHIFNDVGGDVRLWQNLADGEVHHWAEWEENPTHWMYAPEYLP